MNEYVRHKNSNKISKYRGGARIHKKSEKRWIKEFSELSDNTSVSKPIIVHTWFVEH